MFESVKVLRAQFERLKTAIAVATIQCDGGRRVNGIPQSILITSIYQDVTRCAFEAFRQVEKIVGKKHAPGASNIKVQESDNPDGPWTDVPVEQYSVYSIPIKNFPEIITSVQVAMQWLCDRRIGPTSVFSHEDLEQLEQVNQFFELVPVDGPTGILGGAGERKRFIDAAKAVVRSLEDKHIRVFELSNELKDLDELRKEVFLYDRQPGVVMRFEEPADYHCWVRHPRIADVYAGYLKVTKRATVAESDAKGKIIRAIDGWVAFLDDLATALEATAIENAQNRCSKPDWQLEPILVGDKRIDLSRFEELGHVADSYDPDSSSQCPSVELLVSDGKNYLLLSRTFYGGEYAGEFSVKRISDVDAARFLDMNDLPMPEHLEILRRQIVGSADELLPELSSLSSESPESDFHEGGNNGSRIEDEMQDGFHLVENPAACGFVLFSDIKRSYLPEDFIIDDKDLTKFLDENKDCIKQARPLSNGKAWGVRRYVFLTDWEKQKHRLLGHPPTDFDPTPEQIQFRKGELDRSKGRKRGGEK